jgi:hypothetical protein
MWHYGARPLRAALAASLAFVATATLVGILICTPIYAFEVRPNKDFTGGSVIPGGPDAVCGHAKEHRGPMFAGKRDVVLRPDPFRHQDSAIAQPEDATPSEFPAHGSAYRDVADAV